MYKPRNFGNHCMRGGVNMTKTQTRGNRAVHYITLLLTTAAIILTLLAVSILTDDGTNPALPGPACLRLGTQERRRAGERTGNGLHLQAGCGILLHNPS